MELKYILLILLFAAVAAVLFRVFFGRQPEQVSHFSKKLPSRKGHHLYAYRMVRPQHEGDRPEVLLQVYFQNDRQWCRAYVDEISGGTDSVEKGRGKDALWVSEIHEDDTRDIKKTRPRLFILAKVPKTPYR